MVRLARVVVVCCAVSLGASGLWAQGSRGNVQGTVVGPSGRPLAAAQVFVVGTRFFAVTLHDGTYAIRGVPVGQYSMRAQFVGFPPARVANVRVVPNQWVTVDFELEADSLVARERPIHRHPSEQPW